MIIELWVKIAYMVQLMAACLIFVLKAPKKRHYVWKMSISGASILTLAYVINYYYPEGYFGIFSVFYWLYYIAASIVFTWSGMESSLPKVIYYTICACTVQHIAFDFYWMLHIFQKEESWYWAFIYFLIYVGIYWISFHYLATKLVRVKDNVINRQSMISIVTVIVLVWVLSFLESSTPGLESSFLNAMLYRILDVLCCYYVLWVQCNQQEKMSLQRELDGINNAWQQQAKQYQITTETIESINRKCHDLKYQIRAMRQMEGTQERENVLKELENEIMIYDTAIKTGSKALDVVLMDKGLFCKNHDIQWSCMVDGSQLDFMKLEDIYAIFGNALDNAIEAVLELQDREKRIISVKIITQKDLVVVQIQNYFNKQLQFQDGMPMTNKKNKLDHGFGMKSIQYIAEKYNGTIAVQVKQDIFSLQILLPVMPTLGEG